MEDVQQLLRLLESTGDDLGAMSRLAVEFWQLGALSEAAAVYRRIVEQEPGFAEAHYNLARVELLLGHFDTGWAEYEWRLSTPRGQSQSRDFAQPLWTGESLRGKTILLHAEQGLSDTLQFARYADLVKRLGAKVILEVEPPLVRIVRTASGVNTVVSQGETRPQHDMHCWLLSLPRLFATKLGNIPAEVPYLRADVALVEQWRRELSRFDALRVGVVWTGNPASAHNRTRSFPPGMLATISELPGVQLFSLQKGQVSDAGSGGKESVRLVDLGDRLADLADTAAVMANLDLVIACESAAAHLAGALGVPVWVPLAFVPSWRWLLGRGDSPWYPTMRLFRQPQPGDWEEVFERIVDELRGILDRPRPSAGR